jgi:hypothetical protein
VGDTHTNEGTEKGSYHSLNCSPSISPLTVPLSTIAITAPSKIWTSHPTSSLPSVPSPSHRPSPQLSALLNTPLLFLSTFLLSPHLLSPLPLIFSLSSTTLSSPSFSLCVLGNRVQAPCSQRPRPRVLGCQLSKLSLNQNIQLPLGTTETRNQSSEECV